MAMDPVTAALDIGGKLIDRLWPDPAQRDAAKLELLRMQQAGELAQLTADTDIAKGQLAVNAAEASSGNRYAANWRPSVGYVCVIGLAYSFLLQPVLPWLLTTFGHQAPPLPALDTGVLITLLGGLLGLGGMRTTEKIKGVA